MIVGLGFFYQLSYKQDATVLAITETARTSAINNADHISRLEAGQLFISKENFEKDFIERMRANHNVTLSEDVNYIFDYLDQENGSIKAIRVTISESGENLYQATVKVNISDQ